MVSKMINSGARTVTVEAGREGQRLDNFLVRHLPGVPKTAVYRFIRTGQVRVNGGRAKPATRLEAGDRVRIPPVRHADQSVVSVPPGVLERLESSIVYEDADLLVVDKPAGLAVHAGSGVKWGVIDAARQLRPDGAVELVHRLDRETSGCLVMARNTSTMRHLHEQFRLNRANKGYLCLMDGTLPQERITVDAPLRKFTRSGERYMEVAEDGKEARTVFRLLERRGGFSFVEARPVTGRTHQIRVHAAYLGAPLAGDTRYGSGPGLERWLGRGLQRLFLHAHALAFEDAAGTDRQFACPLPVELREVLDAL